RQAGFLEGQGLRLQAAPHGFGAQAAAQPVVLDDRELEHVALEEVEGAGFGPGEPPHLGQHAVEEGREIGLLGQSEPDPHQLLVGPGQILYRGHWSARIVCERRATRRPSEDLPSATVCWPPTGGLGAGAFVGDSGPPRPRSDQGAAAGWRAPTWAAPSPRSARDGPRRRRWWCR